MIDIFNINWRNVGDNLTPWFWRDINLFKPTNEPYWLKDYIFSILSPLTTITNALFGYASDKRRALKYSGQVAVLEICLNDYFDTIDRRIYISDTIPKSNDENLIYIFGDNTPIGYGFTMYTYGESNPKPLIMYTTAEGSGNVDFYVNVPAGLSFDFNRMTQIVNIYTQAGKRFEINTF